MNTAFYIDDTGTPGQDTPSIKLSQYRKSWVGILFSPNERLYAEKQMLGCIEAISERYNASEFHFTEIYSGKGSFSEVELSERLRIIMCFAEIFKKHHWPIIVQTFDPKSLPKMGIVLQGKVKVDGFNLSNHSDLSLFYLLFLLKQHLNKYSKKYPLPADIIVDEGRQKSNTTQHCELLKNVSSNNEIKYQNSILDPLLQLADFAAFCTNRTQWILVKEKQSRSKLDESFLEIVEHANFNYINISKEKIDLSKWSTDNYDYLIWQDDVEKRKRSNFGL